MLNRRPRSANYNVVAEKPDEIIIRDVGPWERHPTVTNDAEGVVADLHREGRLPAGRRLLYYDSWGELDQLLHDGQGRFTGFAPGGRRAGW